MVTKRQLREAMKRRRDAIPEGMREKKSLAIARRLLSLPEYAGNGSFLVYSAIRSEVSLQAFCAQASDDGKRLYFPRVTGNEMEFYRVTHPLQLKRGSFSVMEPDLNVCADKWQNDDPAAVLVPGIAFSEAGGRIGYGGGYYDRYLNAHPKLTAVGVCFAAQMEETVEQVLAAHDRRMERIVTESGIYVTKRGENNYEAGGIMQRST